MAKGSGGSQLGCGAKFLKFCLISFNIVFFILGIVILAIGIYVLVDPKFNYIKNIANFDLAKNAAQSGINLSYIDKCGIAFIVFGGVMFLISFMGCCGAFKQIKCLLVLYAIILLMILLAEIAFGIFAAIYAKRFREFLTPTLQTSIKYEYYGDMSNKTIVSIAWDVVMYNFECCGLNNAHDFNQTNNVWSDRNGTSIPRACCIYPNQRPDWSGVIRNSPYYPNCVINPTTNTSNFETGCYDKITGFVNQYSLMVIVAAIVIGVILASGVLFSLWLCKMIANAGDYA